MSRSMRDALLRAGVLLALSPLAWGQAVVDWGSCRSFCSQTEIGNALIEIHMPHGEAAPSPRGDGAAPKMLSGPPSALDITTYVDGFGRGRAITLPLLREVLATQASVWIETDMRAHLNPRRQAVIRRAAQRLADRLSQHCPACQAPGYGIDHLEHGLPCQACTTPTTQAAREHWLCPACGHSETRQRPERADPVHCPSCNP